jgi:hypothetical protein
VSTPPALGRSGYRWLRKRAKRARSHAWLARLKLANRRSQRSVLGSADVIVSLTTYGRRLDSVAYTIESIAAGRVRPRRLVLWLDDADAYEHRPESVRRLERRGLEVGLTTNYGPHTKYFPTLAGAIAAGLPIVTADDDILYPRTWLSGLLDAAASHPGVVNCYRASVVSVADGHIAGYDSWPRCTDTVTSVTRFATGVAGVHYPLAMLEALADRGEEFLARCPRADDIWLHWVALRAGIEVRQLAAKPVHFPIIPGTQAQSLMAENVVGGANDRWIEGLYDTADVEVLTAAGAPVLAG